MEDNKPTRRNFVKVGLATGALAALGNMSCFSGAGNQSEGSGEKIKLLGPDGTLVEVDKAAIKPAVAVDNLLRNQARQGIPGRKWVMVIDLARCKHALNCQKACNKHHFIPGDRQWLNILEMQESEHTAPYWFPKPCFHCDRPPCVAVCPVDATFKRSDGIVLIDNERCVGCRFCMAACPYSVRVFNWGKTDNPAEIKNNPHDPETGLPRKMGTVEKCDFCPDMLRVGKLPHCVTACPNGVYFFGDLNEDTVTNGSETYRFSEMVRDKAGYRYMEDLGTEPSVYYLPPVDRLVPFDETKKDFDKHLDEPHH